MEKLKLNNNNTIDILGLGTYEMKKEEAEKSVQSAMAAGYRLYDTAQVYKNEKEVSDAITRTGVGRDSIFLTTKVATANQGYDKAKASVLDSMKAMGQEYLNLVLIHWPGVSGVDAASAQNKALRHGTYRALTELQKEGLVKNIGVSNFMIPHLRQLFEEFDERPQVNQIELSPICYPKDVVDFCQENGVVVQSYSTLGRGLLLSNEWIEKYPVLKRMQGKGSLSNQILKWAMQKQCCVIPKSKTPERIAENFQALTTVLHEEDALALDNFPVQHRTCWDPNTIN
ncbi:hypothetical protein NECID01_1901 [Nematocida sp. AWRm77]|nr:hypothetical protein NECID01_1901 [Nematocida sp. AWRm77]